MAYDILPDGTITPAATPEEGEIVRRAFDLIASSPFDGSRSHLRAAAQLINTDNAAGAVRESIHAVESVVRLISPHNFFEGALKEIEKKGNIHPALKLTLSKLYGYTSDEKGIRHPLLDEGVAQVGMPEAVFMYGACASFISYLVVRARNAGVLKS